MKSYELQPTSENIYAVFINDSLKRNKDIFQFASMLNVMDSNYSIAVEVCQGKWGNGAERERRLTMAGYDYKAIQSIVNSIINDFNAAPTEPKQENFLEVEIDLNKYDGINLKFRKDYQ